MKGVQEGPRVLTISPEALELIRARRRPVYLEAPAAFRAG